MIFAIDTETVAREPIIKSTELVVMSVCDGKKTWLLNPSDATDFMTEHLPTATFVGANIAFEWMSLGLPLKDVFKAYQENRVQDITINQKLIDNYYGRLFEGGMTYSLDDLAELYKVGRKLDPYWRIRYVELKDTPIIDWPTLARDYAAHDATLTYKVYEKQQGQPNLKDSYIESYTALTTYLSDFNGLTTNKALLPAAKALIEGKVADSVAYFQSVGLIRKEGDVNPKTKSLRPIRPAQIGTVNKEALELRVLEAYGEHTPRSEKTGKPKTDRETLENSGDPILERWADEGVWKKYESTYLPIFERDTVHPRTGTIIKTGRMSSSNPNLQNIPQDNLIRNLFKAPEGYALLSVDLPGGELRTFGYAATKKVGFSKMLEAIKTGKDPHAMVASDLLNITYDEGIKLKKAGDERFDKFRAVAKIKNFGSLGMMGFNSFVIHCRKKGIRLCTQIGGQSECGTLMTVYMRGEMPVRLCRHCQIASEQLHKAWLRTWPEVPLYFKIVQAEGDRVLITGTNFYRGGCSAPEAANAHFQGLLGRLFKHAWIRITEEMYTDEFSPLYGSRLLNPIHDEFLAAIKIGVEVSSAVDRMCEIVKQTAEEYCPGTEGCWPLEPKLMDVWSKDAKSVKKDGKWVISHIGTNNT